jgi:glycosyltransferase involved in cell wall biosynthesis
MKLMDITAYYHNCSGGIKTYIQNKIKWLEDKLIEHVVVIPGKENRTYTVGRSKFYELSSFRLIGGYRYFRSIKEINEVIEKEKPDIVELGGTYIIAPFLKKGSYLLSIFYHADAKREIGLLPLPATLKREFFMFVVENCLRKADVVLAPSQRCVKELKECGLERVVYTPLGIDVSLFSPDKHSPLVKRRYGIPEGKCTLIYVGRLSPEKRIKDLLKSLSYLDPERFHLLVVGSGPLQRLIKSAIKKYKNISYIPYLSQEELAALYASSDIFVSASKFETFGFSFLEAQASGLPVCAYDLDLETQLLKDALAKEHTPQALAERVLNVSYLLDYELRQTLSKLVRKTFTFDQCFDRIFQVYEEILGLRNVYVSSLRRSYSIYVG